MLTFTKEEKKDYKEEIKVFNQVKKGKIKSYLFTRDKDRNGDVVYEEYLTYSIRYNSFSIQVCCWDKISKAKHIHKDCLNYVDISEKQAFQMIKGVFLDRLLGEVIEGVKG